MLPVVRSARRSSITPCVIADAKLFRVCRGEGRSLNPLGRKIFREVDRIDLRRSVSKLKHPLESANARRNDFDRNKLGSKPSHLVLRARN